MPSQWLGQALRQERFSTIATDLLTNNKIKAKIGWAHLSKHEETMSSRRVNLRLDFLGNRLMRM